MPVKNATDLMPAAKAAGFKLVEVHEDRIVLHLPKVTHTGKGKPLRIAADPITPAQKMLDEAGVETTDLRLFPSYPNSVVIATLPPPVEPEAEEPKPAAKPAAKKTASKKAASKKTTTKK